MPTDLPYSIADLARLTGVNVRTIRYYLAQGLLPASGESGPGAHYGEGHLDRLRLTKRLQAQHLPLSEIRQRLGELTDADVATLVVTPVEPASDPATSALDYVRSVLGASASPRSISMPTGASPSQPPSQTTSAGPVAPAAAGAPASPAAPARPLLARARYAAMGIVSEPGAMTMGAPIEPGVGEAAADAAASSPVDPDGIQPMPLPRPISVEPGETDDTATEPPAVERSQWERLGLGPNVELHVRRPLSRLEQKRVERLITIARQVLKEDSK